MAPEKQHVDLTSNHSYVRTHSHMKIGKREKKRDTKKLEETETVTVRDIEKKETKCKKNEQEILYLRFQINVMNIKSEGRN